MTEQEFNLYFKQKNYDYIEDFRVDNAVILAAGFASRFAPLSYTTPKALLPVCGEVLIERQIRQLLSAGIHEIFVVTGYKQEMFAYLTEKYGVRLLEAPGRRQAPGGVIEELFQRLDIRAFIGHL